MGSNLNVCSMNKEVNTNSVADDTSSGINKQEGGVGHTARRSFLSLDMQGYNLPARMNSAKSKMQSELQRKKIAIPTYTKYPKLVCLRTVNPLELLMNFGGLLSFI